MQPFLLHGVSANMKLIVGTGLLMRCGILAMASAFAQPGAFAQQGSSQQQPAQTVTQAAAPDTNPVPLDWTPPALATLSAQAAVKDSFTLDRNMLRVAAGLVPDSDAPTRQAIGKLDGVNVHTLRFGPAGVPDEAAVNAIREAYHLRGWKHFVTTTDSGGPVHNGHVDVWTVLDGVNVRGAVILAETPKSVTLITVAGNLSPVDILHLRGHFGIPRFDEDGLRGQR